MLAYPEILPLDAITLAAEIVKARAIQARKQEFALATWNVQGYVQRMTLGVPTLPGTMEGDDGCDCDDETMEALLGLEAALYEFDEEANFGAEDEMESISIITLLAIASAVMQLITFLRNRKDIEPQA
jgi:hypothetical protein